jgi:hypothetical protein
MKCLLCPTEIDELRAFPPTVGPGGVSIEDTLGKWKHAQAVAAWTHLTLTAQLPAGSLTVLSGHVCPEHSISADGIALAAKTSPKSHEKNSK